MTETMSCGDCGTTWPRPVTRGRRPKRCTPCNAAAKRARQQQRAQGTAADTTPKLAANVTRYRLGIELARTGIRCGRQQEVTEILDAIIDGTATEAMLTEKIVAAARRVTLTRLSEMGVDLTPAADYLRQVSA